MKRKIKRHMTLLETLIAVSLISVVLTLVLGFFRELAEISRLTEVRQKESFQSRYVESRLSFLFERLVNENEDTKREFYFFTQGADRNFSPSTSLIFTFNNEARANSAYSGDLLARLFVDDQYRLCLATWPLYTEQPHLEMQKEILLENVADVHYEFYAAPERGSTDKNVKSTTVDPQKIEPEKDRWHAQEWLKSYNQMPSIMRLTVKLVEEGEDVQQLKTGARVKTKDLLFAFVLPCSKNYIYYPAN